MCIPALKATVKAVLPMSLLRTARLIAGRRTARIHFGDLKRTSPISAQFGSDRGTPIDRYYIERFLAEKAACIQGRVLEVADNHYTKRFGCQRVTSTDILHVNASNPNATIIGDLGCADVLPAAAFDCIIFTQTLQYIFDIRAAIRQLHQALKRGGVLLLTVPGISQLATWPGLGQADEEWAKTWYWSLTTFSTRRLLEEQFGSNGLEVKMYGNVFAATAFLYGVTLQEVDRADLDVINSCYPVTITAYAVRGS